MILRNIRQAGPEMAADFTAPDGRIGCITVPLALYEQHGERILQDEAAACIRQSRRHGYRAPEEDRFNELR